MGNIGVYLFINQKKMLLYLIDILEQFNQELGQKITEYFSKKQVEWLPISKPFSETLQKWPANTRHEACVSDI
jgi:hypothetical protein